MIHEVCSCGFPHSDTRGSADMCSSPRLFAAYHVLLRLPVPRHSPCALLQLTSVRYCFLTFGVFLPLGSSEPPSGTSAISPAVPCTSVYMVFCLSAPSRAAMCGLFSCLYQTFLNFMIGLPLRLRFASILSSIRFLSVVCAFFLTKESFRLTSAYASVFLSVSFYKKYCFRVCSFQGTSMPSSFCVRPLPS